VHVSDLEVAIGEVEYLGTRLKALGSDLEKTDGHVSYGKTALVHAKVIDAMDNFRGNWNDNRDHLADKLQKLGDLATQAAKSFTEQDEDLARQIRKVMEHA
jgi:hypothetical protein